MNLKPFTSLQDLADFLRTMDNSETAEIGFDMGYTDLSANQSSHPCGTACCIGGWVSMVNRSSLSLSKAVQTLAPEIDLNEYDQLCWPQQDHIAWDATPIQASRAVEILAETGKCDWDRAMSVA